MHGTNINRGVALVLLMIVALGASAQDEAGAEPDRLTRGIYLAPMGSYILNDDKDFDDGAGGTLALGYRKNWWGVEGSALIAQKYDGDSGSNTDVDGGTLNALVFPFDSLPNLFGLIGAGSLGVDQHPVIGASYTLTTIEGGVGYIFPLSIGSYDFGIRADARYRYGSRHERSRPDPGDLEITRDFQDALFNLGLQLPLGLRPPPPAPVAAPVAVVAPVVVCADGTDNDGDGLVDHPADPGCASPEDNDETDPPQCSDSKDNDGDGLIDFPADKGCTGADDNDEVDPCKSPVPGERISLNGCGTGDVIVLRGVNFEFDQSRLTPNAKTILDGVAEELVAYPEIKIELGGHTDAKGSDEYNQSLSERRAASVVAYLKGRGITNDRMSSAGYGESQPVADNETDEGRELNRRVELKVTAGVAAASVVDASANAAPADVGAAATAPDPAAEAAPVAPEQP